MCFRGKKNWEQCGHLNGEEEIRIENHFLFFAFNENGEHRRMSWFGKVDTELSTAEIDLRLWDVETEMSSGQL